VPNVTLRGRSALLPLALLLGLATPVAVPTASAASTATSAHAAATSLAPDDHARAKRPKPVVTRVKPASGPTSGGTKVKVKGKNFTKVKKVVIGGRKARIVKIKSPRKVIVIAPAHAAGTVPVRVRTKAGKSRPSRKARFTYVAPPVVTTLTPSSGPTAGGTAVQISGTGLKGATVVSFGGTAAPFTVVSDTRINATAPPHAAGGVPVTVRTPAGLSPPRTYTYEEPPPPGPPPVVLLVAPAAGSMDGGTVVTITGTGFTGATAVAFGGTAAAFAVDSATSITATTPAHAPGPVEVAVTTPNGTSTVQGLFTYLPLPPVPPVVVLVAPLTGTVDGGTPVTITGTGFSGATAVSFGGTAATSFTVDSDTSISAVTPAHALGPVTVSVTTPAGTSTVPGLFSYLPIAPPPPVVVLVAPLTGPVTGGTAVTITGTGFTGATAVAFDGTAAASFTVDSDTSISAETPAHAAGLVAVSVTTPQGTSSVPGLFTYSPLPTPPPVVVLVAPLIGSPAGGTPVTITGTGFTGATAVSFGGTAATSFTVNSDISISATAPAHSIGPVTVSVTTPGGTSTVPGLFAYLI
jgi:hypothetical protein